MGKESHEKSKGVAIGAAIGAVVGVVTGILFAPKSGKETRKDIKDSATNASEKVQAEIKKLEAEAKELIAKGEEKAKTLSGNASKTAKKHVDEVRHYASNVATVVKSFKAGESDDKDLDKAITKLKDARTALKNYLKK